MEPRRDGPGRPFSEYYTQTPTHIWIHDLETGSLEEICTKDRLAPFETPALLLAQSERLLVQVVRKNVGQIFSVRLDGSDPREFTRAGEGLPYGLSLSPDGKRVAFHLASPQGYQVWTSDTDGSNRVRIAAKPGHLYFGTSWSPDGRWILLRGLPARRRTGSRLGRRLHWSRGRERTPGAHERQVDVVRRNLWRSEDAGRRVECARMDPRRLHSLPSPPAGFQGPLGIPTAAPDVDHFNRDFKPELARGGTEICRLDPRDGQITILTQSEPPLWDFRASESPDGKFVAFCRAKTGGPPAIWVMDADGKDPRLITRGVDNRGADHPRWF